MTNEQKKQILLDLIKIEENGEIFNFTRAERKGFQIWVEGLINQQESLEQENVIDKIRAEIMQLDYDIESVDYDYNDMACTETVHTICREEVLRIIDKYKAESEGKE